MNSIYDESRLDDESAMLTEAIRQAQAEATSLYILLDKKTNNIMGIVTVALHSFALDMVTCMSIVFLFVSKPFRNKKYMLRGSPKLASVNLLDLCVELTYEIDEKVPIKHIFLQAICQSVANRYAEYGFSFDPAQPLDMLLTI